MADLTDLQAAQAVKVIGSDSSGVESVPLQTTANGAALVSLRDSSGTEIGTPTSPIITSTLLNASGVQGAISVSTTAVAVRVGGSNLTNRKVLSFYNNGTATIYWGYTNSVTSSTGTPLMRNQQVIGDWGPSTTIYLIAVSGSHDVRVNEGA